jgi:hypothetical protein
MRILLRHLGFVDYSLLGQRAPGYVLPTLRIGAGTEPVPRTSKLVSVLTALEEPSGRLDPRSDNGGGGRGGPRELQRRQLFGQDLG